MSDLTYENESGDSVFTSKFLKNRGTCCKTCCLHCPYGHTLKTLGLQFQELSSDKISIAQSIIDGGVKKEEFSLSASFLNEAFGAPKKAASITTENFKDYKFVIIKEVVCGLIKVGSLQATEIFLKEQFKKQDLSLEMVNSYYEV